MHRTAAAGILSAFLAVALLLSLVVSVPAVYSAGAPLLTTSATESGFAQKTIAGVPGFLVSYTDNRAYNISALVYVDLTNSAGQTVYWNYGGSCVLNAGGTGQCFVHVSSNLKGNYTATVFATSLTNVPLSDASTFPVSL